MATCPDMLFTRRILKTHLRFWITNYRVDAWAIDLNLFFVLAMGRSGTCFLAHLLDRAEGAHVIHEPVGEDFIAYQHAFHDADAAHRYVRCFRKKEIYLRERPLEIETYGEVNSSLRRHARALAGAFPNAALLHLVRDGRDVVRSMSARRTMTPEDKNTRTIRPHPDDRWASQWEHMDRFARLCWYWQVDNAYLRQNIGRTVQFEALLSSYDYLCEHLLEPVGLQLPPSVWEEAVNRPRNVTKEHAMPPWEQWTPAQKRTFRAICGEEMRKNGYDF